MDWLLIACFKLWHINNLAEIDVITENRLPKLQQRLLCLYYNSQLGIPEGNIPLGRQRRNQIIIKAKPNIANYD